MGEHTEMESILAAIEARVVAIAERKKTAAVDIEIVKLGVFDVMDMDATQAKEYVRRLSSGKLEKLKADGIVKMTVPKEVIAAQNEDIKAIVLEARKAGIASSKQGGTGTPRAPEKVTNFFNTLKSPEHSGQTGADVMYLKLKEVDASLEKQDDGTYVGKLIKINKLDPTNGRLQIAYRTSEDALWKGYNMNNPGTLAWNVKKAFGIVGTEESAS